MGIRMITRRTLVALCILLVLTGQAFADRYVRLTILHTNDTHSHLLPFSYPKSTTIDGKPLPAYRNIGGIARRATLIKQMKASHQPLIVMDAGDLIDGSPFSIEFAGEAEFAADNASGYDVIVTGNHEYSNTMPNFLKRLSEAQFPVLGANVFKSDGSPLLTPYMLINQDGLRIAILGLVTSNDYTAVKEGKLTIKDPIQAAKEWVPKLRQDADAVILLTHIGYDVDLQLAKQVPGIDAIIGGHSHTRPEHPVLVEHAPDSDPFTLDGTVVAQDFQWGGDLGELDLTFRKGAFGWALMSFGGKLIPITSDIPEDRYVRDAVEKYHKKIAAKYDTVIGEASADFVGEAPTNMVNDAMWETYSADFAMQNYGGVRTDLVQGPITTGDIAMLFPFGNATLTFQITGAELKSLLLKSTPAVSGIKYRIQGGKLVSMEIGGQPIDDAKTYKGVTHSFFASSNFGPETKTTDTGITIRDLIVNYIRAKRTISPDAERRAQF